jgi:hypothetical protein
MSNDPKLELRAIKTNRALSEETLYFSAKLFVDGKLAATVANRGTGGCNTYSWVSKETEARVNAWANQQDLEFKFECLDQIIDKLLSSAEVAARLRRLCRKETLFRLRNDKQGAWRVVKKPYDDTLRLKIEEHAKGTLECIANVDIDAAVKFC